MSLQLLHPSCLALGWDGELVAVGFGRRWRAHGDRWVPAPHRPLHALHHRGPTRRVEVVGGYVYTEGPYGWRATARTEGDEVRDHPSGAVALVRDGVAHRAALPGRSPIDIPELLADSLRFGPRGRHLLGLGATGGVQVDLATGHGVPLPGVPLGVGVLLDEGSVWRWPDGAFGPRREATLVATGLVEASPAVGPTLLAGPAGRLWSLADGTPSADAPIALGATAAVGDGFATVPFDGDEGWLVDPHGRTLARFPVPLPPDDLVVALSVRHGRLLGHTAGGRTLDLAAVSAPDRAGGPRLGPVDTPLGPMDDALLATHADHHYAASESGWLLSWSHAPPRAP